ncbi:MAG: class II aldolase/adducin family protein [Verrucomicrobia bacterium]|nr:MAG: class II aldolase/adducin family protein [Verrucomicrobiota bacterium]
MKQVITAREAEQILRNGGPDSIPADALLTPSARDILRSGAVTPARANEPASPASQVPSAMKTEPIIPDHEYHWTSGADPRTPADVAAFYNSPEIVAIKRHMVDIGRRIWEKDYVDGNGGNITVRVGDDLVLCTPTLISKGFMKVDDICLVDMEGNQLAGTLKRTSEVLTHIGIMKRQPKAKSCVHAHPPHATAFAVASVTPPTCMIPEAEVFLGQIGFAPYQTPGSPENSDTVGEIGVNHQSIIMQNHGVICWGKDVEDSYWKMENTDAYCKTIWIASQLGNGLHTFGKDKLKDLMDIRQKLGMDDKREEWKECELCDNSEFRPGVVCSVPGTPVAGKSAADPGPGSDPQLEALVTKITGQIMDKLGN